MVGVSENEVNTDFCQALRKTRIKNGDMSYNWINAKDYTMNCFLLFDRWALNGLAMRALKVGLFIITGNRLERKFE